MVKVTDKAKQALDHLRSDAVHQLPEQTKAEQEPALRLIIEGSQAGLALDFPQENDQVVENDGHAVLLIDDQVGLILDGTVVDVAESPDGEKLTIRREEPGSSQAA